MMHVKNCKNRISHYIVPKAHNNSIKIETNSAMARVFGLLHQGGQRGSFAAKFNKPSLM